MSAPSPNNDDRNTNASARRRSTAPPSAPPSSANARPASNVIGVPKTPARRDASAVPEPIDLSALKTASATPGVETERRPTRPVATPSAAAPSSEPPSAEALRRESERRKARPVATPSAETAKQTQANAAENAKRETPSLPASRAEIASAATKPVFKLTLALVADAAQRQEIQERATAAAPRLPRASVGTPYQESLDLGALLLENASDARRVRFELVDVNAVFADFGLKCRLVDDRVLQLSGTPTRHLFTRLHIEIRCDDATTASLLFPFNIQPDPWALWEYREPPKDAPYPVDHLKKAARPFPGTDKLVLAASRRGRSHEHKGAFRDDDFAFHVAGEGEWSFFATADGAGSAEFSRQGAKIACETVVAQLKKNFAQNPLPEPLFENHHRASQSLFAVFDGFKAPNGIVYNFHSALHKSYRQIYAECQKYNATLAPNQPQKKLKDFHTTLLCCAIKKYPNFWAILSYWIGDGAFAIYGPNGERRVEPLGEPDGGEFAGQTRFFTMAPELAAEPIQRRFRMTFLNDFDALVMATDGVADPYFEVAAEMSNMENWGRFWNARGREALFENVFAPDASPEERAENLLQGLHFKELGHSDDRTLLLLLNPARFAGGVRP
ncbi:MAG: protein phosphatase 2C domain-containing protein [Thermoguttaceae bacterium]|nr:protein phosphatase 2C domain-containing protein [Thermoguttaceae bacterium]